MSVYRIPYSAFIQIVLKTNKQKMALIYQFPRLYITFARF